jgi:preprotein translocase subunit SecG
MSFIFGTLLTILAIFLILLVLVQRGRGGGLTGALGGMGGSSAFGAKAGDVFTRITIITAGIWIVVCAAAVFWANHRVDRLGAIKSTAPASSSSIQAPATKLPGSETEKASEAPATEGSTTTESTAPPAETPAPPSEQPASDAK